jgi:hypothetical protein
MPIGNLPISKLTYKADTLEGSGMRDSSNLYKQRKAGRNLDCLELLLRPWQASRLFIILNKF